MRKAPTIAVIFTLALAACSGQPAKRSPAAAPTTPTLTDYASHALAAGGKRSGTVSIDVVDVRANGNSKSTDITIANNQTLYVLGWAMRDTGQTPCPIVALAVDRSKSFAASYGLPRPDVASFYKNDAAANVGYVLAVPAGALGTGRHTAEVVCANADGSDPRDAARGITVTVR